MRSSTERINIAASAQKLDVDNRISLRYYYRIADNILKQVYSLIIFIYFPVELVVIYKCVVLIVFHNSGIFS